uniref:Mitochondrial ATP synthase regulatory component factor B n=1 Tax=Strongyloides papillosus TaxID=174720 RepID=A0A0N5CA38_STREA
MVVDRKICSPALFDSEWGYTVRRYIQYLKREFNSAETYILLDKLKHQLPVRPPAWMWKSSFTLRSNFFDSECLLDFDNGLHDGKSTVKAAPDYVSFLLPHGDLGSFYRRRMQPPFLRNVALCIDRTAGIGPTHFPIENMPSWKGLAVSNNGRLCGQFPTSLEILILNPTDVNDGSDYASLLKGLHHLKVLVINECALLDRLPPLRETLPALEALVCLEFINPCRCFNKVEAFLPDAMGILAGRERKEHVITWHGHIFFSTVDVLSRVCDVKLPREFQLVMDTHSKRMARKRRHSTTSI